MDLETTQRHIAHHGKMQEIAGRIAAKEGRHDDAARHAARADAAAKGRLLHGTQESTDSIYMYLNNKLFSCAYEHGLVTHDFQEPSLV